MGGLGALHGCIVCPVVLFPFSMFPYHCSPLAASLSTPQAVAHGMRSSAWWWWCPCPSTSQAGLGSGVVLLALVIIILPQVVPPMDMVCCSCPVLIPIVVHHCCCLFIFVMVSVCCCPCSHPHHWGTLIVVISLSSWGCCYGGGVHCPACPSLFFVIVLWSHGTPSIAPLSTHEHGSQPWWVVLCHQVLCGPSWSWSW
jgi:hypothetical protein